MVEQERCLCLITEGKILGMDVRKLMPTTEEEEKKAKEKTNWWWEWESKPPPGPPPFDFIMDLSVINTKPFVFDSKILLAGGLALPPHSESEEPAQMVPCFDIYEFAFDAIGEKEEPRLLVSESIPEAPVQFPFFESLVANVSGDCYFLVLNTMVNSGENVFWVLRSGLTMWEPLPPPPPLAEHPDFQGRHRFLGDDAQLFALHDRLYLRAYVYDEPIYAEPMVDAEPTVDAEPMVDAEPTVDAEPVDAEPAVDEPEEDERILYEFFSFNTRTKTWTQLADDDSFMNSFHVRVHGLDKFCFPSITFSSVRGLSDSNCSVMLSCSFLKEIGADSKRCPRLPDPVIHALLVNQYGVHLFQPIVEYSFYGILPDFASISPFLVDLGDGKVCALLYGIVDEVDVREIPVLCVSVFTLTMKDGLDDIDTEVSPKERRFFSKKEGRFLSARERSFLSVNVLSKRVYNMNDYSDYTIENYSEGLQQVFICPPTKKDKDMSRKRKGPPH